MDNVVNQNKRDKTSDQHDVNFSALTYFDTYLNDEFPVRWLIHGSGLCAHGAPRTWLFPVVSWVSYTAFISAICTEGKMTEDSHFCLFLAIYHLDESLLLENEI